MNVSTHIYYCFYIRLNIFKKVVLNFAAKFYRLYSIPKSFSNRINTITELLKLKYN